MTHESRKRLLAPLALLSSLFLVGHARMWLSAPAVADDANRVGAMGHVKVLSNRVEDVSSPEAWAESNIKPGMTDQEKVLAIWHTVVKYRHQTAPPNEWIQDNVHDVFKTSSTTAARWVTN